jgi:hypothetical protein
MSLKGDVYGKRTLDFVERLQKLTDYVAICQEIQKELEWFGLTCVTAWSMPRPGRPPDEGMIFNNRPQEYIDRYKEKNYLVRDPLVTELRTSVNPYSWNDVRKRRKLSRAEASIMDEGRDFGVRTASSSPSSRSPGRSPSSARRDRTRIYRKGHDPLLKLSASTANKRSNGR